MKTQKTKYLFFVTLIVIAVIAGILITGNGSKSKFRDQLKLGNEALLNMDYEGAITAFANAIGLNPKDVEAYLGISKAYIALGDYENASDYLSKGYYSIPVPTILGMLDSVEVKDLIALGNSFLSKGDANLAEDAFDEVLNQEPSNEEAEKGKQDAALHPNYVPNSDDKLENSKEDESNKKNNNKESLSFHPSDITFMGYPVTEDHYEEWKIALNYTGNDTIPQSSNCSNEFSNHLSCLNNGNSGENNYGYIRQIELMDMATPKNNLPVYLGWYDYEVPRSYMFVWNQNDNWDHIADQYVSSPIRLGMTYEEALAICGYTGEIDFSQEPFQDTGNIEIIGFSFDTYDGISVIFSDGIFVKLSLVSHGHTGIIDSIYLDTYLDMHIN